MKKILFLCSTFAVFAKPYFGLELGTLISKNIATIKGIDAPRPVFGFGNPAYSFSKDENFQNNSMILGAIVGYSFSKFGNLAPFVEADVRHCSSKKEKNIDYDEISGENFLDNETIRIKVGHGFGFMPGVDLAITEKLSALIGVRFNVTQYEVSASHTEGGVIHPADSHKKRTYIFGVEPTLGVKYSFTNNLSTRVTFGYNIGQRKRVINNYIGEQTLVNDGINAGISIRPRGVVIKAALIYTF